MYQKGDFVVKLANGVCKIEDIVHPDFVRDKDKLYYQLMPLSDEKARLYVPIDKLDETTRTVMTEDEAEDLLKRIPEINEVWIRNDKEREQNYKNAIQSNDPEKLVGIIKLIYQRKKNRQEQGKKSTVIDGKYFDIAENLLYSELELVMKKSRNEIVEIIKTYCEKMLT